MKKYPIYDAHIFPNGRIALVKNSDMTEAIEAGKEILIFCGGWSGGYAKAVGAEKSYDPDFGECWGMYGYDIKDTTFSSDDMRKFHKVIITDGIKVYMQTGEPATQYFGGMFCDWDTSFAEFKKKWYYDGETKEDFDEKRRKIDLEMTKRMIGRGKDAEEIWNSIKGYIRGVNEWTEVK